MKNFPRTIPTITINRISNESSPVVCDEVRGWFIIPKLGERSEFAVYDTLTGDRICCIEAEATNKAKVHNIEGVEFAANTFRADGTVKKTQIVAQLSDTCCNFLSYFDTNGDVKRYTTFYDDAVAGYDVNDFGSETHIKQESFAKRDDNDKYIVNFGVRARGVVGRYEVNINGKVFDTVCVANVDATRNNELIEQYIDKNGRTILQREFMSDSMMMKNGMHIGMKSDIFPYSVKVNGNDYVCESIAVTDFAI